MKSTPRTSMRARRLGLLARAQSIGYAVHRFGIAILLVSLVWAAWILWRQYEKVD